MKIVKNFLTIFFIITINNSYALAENSTELYKKIDLFSEVLEKVKKNYVDEVDQVKIMDSAINGILQSLDPYSSYMNPDTFDNSGA